VQSIPHQGLTNDLHAGMQPQAFTLSPNGVAVKDIYDHYIRSLSGQSHLSSAG